MHSAAGETGADVRTGTIASARDRLPSVPPTAARLVAEQSARQRLATPESLIVKSPTGPSGWSATKPVVLGRRAASEKSQGSRRMEAPRARTTCWRRKAATTKSAGSKIARSAGGICGRLAPPLAELAHSCDTATSFISDHPAASAQTCHWQRHAHAKG